MMRLNSRGEESTRGCRWLVAVGLLLALAPACRQAQGERMMADLVLWNGRIFTVDREKPWVEAVAVRDGVIREVGANRALKRWIGKGTEVVDLGGKLMLPGFNDAHVHLADGGFDLLGIRLRDSRDETDFAARIRAYVLRLPKGEWVTGGYWDHETWPTHRYPRRRLIDPFTADHPLLVQRLDGHIALANGAALRLAGISRVTPDPQGGEIEKDPQTGELSGILKDAAIGLVEKVIPPPDRKKRERAIRAALTHASELGLTSVQDNSSPEDLLIYQDLLGRGELSVRLNAWRGADFYKDFARIGIHPGFGCTALRLGTIKLFADGSMGAGTALFYEPYSDDPATAGLAIYPQKELNDLIRDVDRAGLQAGHSRHRRQGQRLGTGRPGSRGSGQRPARRPPSHRACPGGAAGGC